MKRLILFVGLVSILLLTACKNDGGGYTFPRKARFSVEEAESGVCFTATVSDDYAEFVFTKPQTINGLTAITKDGVNYSLTFNGNTISLSNTAVSVATDFTAATELLKNAGKEKGGTICVETGDIYAKANVNNGEITELCFVSGATKRNYRITTEVKE